MASLIQKLVIVLDRENEAYQDMLEISKEKTPVLVKGDLKRLEEITDDEQVIVGKIKKLEKERIGILTEIANVVNRDVTTLKLVNIIEMLGRRPEEQKPLAEVHDKLIRTVGEVRKVNEHNRTLVTSALEMVTFNLNLIQATKAAPETANYTKFAASAGSMMGTSYKGFDASQ